MTDVFAVFEGGGVKGIGLVGALARAQKEPLNFLGFAGASAGAIVAALAAVGYPAWDPAGALLKKQPPDQRFLLDTLDFSQFLDGVERFPLAQIPSEVEDSGG